MRTWRGLLGAALAAFALLAAGASAEAATLPTLKDYTVATSSNVTGYAGWYTRAEATCPTGTVPLAGGVEFESFDLGFDILDSFPSDDGWVVDVRNGLAGVTIDTYAVCAKAPKSYQVVTSGWYGYDQHDQTNGFVACPTGTKALGGGAQTVASTDVYLGQSSPSWTGGSWGVSVVNLWGSDAFQVYAVCAKPLPGYSVVTAPPVVVKAGKLGQASVSCLPELMPVGGGIGFGWSEPDFGLHSTQPAGKGWYTTVNNLSDLDLEIQAMVVCE
jgi:hypothetical protein